MPPPISQSTTAGAAQVPGDNTPNVATTDPNAAQPNTPPVEFDVHISAQPQELSDAIAVLKEAGLDDIAATLEKALSPESQDLNKSTSDLTDEISAMGNNPHGM